jgi:hypothetical protein
MPLTNDEKGPTSPQVNKRVETKKDFPFYDKAAIYKQLQLDSGKYSKVKIIARRGGFDVASYVPLEPADA